MEIKTVNLKNGTEEMAVTVTGVMLNLESLTETVLGWQLILDLVAICRHGPQRGGDVNALQARGLLLPDGTPHGSVKNVVLSAVVEGEGLDMKLVSPIKEN